MTPYFNCAYETDQTENPCSCTDLHSQRPTSGGLAVQSPSLLFHWLASEAAYTHCGQIIPSILHTTAGLLSPAIVCRPSQ
ncbi:unnamed protein product, partial [Pleuronectes platessa]